ncbi:hypothetical protein AVEN_148042-1 [Araneus ventricosus]|uniref:Uncharacterized protein n=1 Tax=Araneus ventricosus TaxID=182803 RepID=A0A4Y2PF04_ARAVE|nr:hypothetical protein AVEN_148042-1 [Araneus ventricosus]
MFIRVQNSGGLSLHFLQKKRVHKEVTHRLAIRQPRSDWVKCEQFLCAVSTQVLVDEVRPPWLEKFHSNRAFGRFKILAAWRELGDSPRDSKWLAGAWWREILLASGLKKREKRGEEDLPDERVPVDKKEKVMRNGKEGGSKCFEAEYSSMKQQNTWVSIYELDSMLLR